MTLLSAFIKEKNSPRSTFAGARALIQTHLSTIAEGRRRRREIEAFRLWMRHELAQQDMGCHANDVDGMLGRELNEIPLGCLGFATLIFQNRGAGKPHGTG